jgi:phage terminase Nu1 subunit (DNA packaging protein)
MATATEAADHVFISPSRFRDLIGVGTITRMPAGKYNLHKVREEYCRNAQRVMQGRAAEGGAALSTQRARLATAQAEAAELKNDVRRGDFIALRLVKCPWLRCSPRSAKMS